MRKMISLCMLCLALFSVVAVSQEAKSESLPSEEANQLDYDKKINDLNEQLGSLKLKLSAIEQQHSQVAKDVGEITRTTVLALDGIESSNTKISNYIKSQKTSFSALENKDVDIAHSIETDWNVIEWNVYGIILSGAISAIITAFIFGVTLNSESKKQKERLEVEITKQENLLKAETSKQAKQLQLETEKQVEAIKVDSELRSAELELKMSSNNRSFEEQHNRVIDEFRQQWINNFRNITSELVGNTYEILSYSELDAISMFKEEDYKTIRKELSNLGSKIESDFSDSSIHLVKLEELKLFQKIYENHPYYKVKALESLIISQKERLILMLNCEDIENKNYDTNDFSIYTSLSYLEEMLSGESLSSALRCKKDDIKKELNRLRELTSEMLKKEWTRVQRK